MIARLATDLEKAARRCKPNRGMKLPVPVRHQAQTMALSNINSAPAALESQVLAAGLLKQPAMRTALNSRPAPDTGGK